MKDNSTIKEKSLQGVEIGGRAVAKPRASEAKPNSPQGLDERIQRALQAAGEKKALDLVLLDLREIASFTDYFLIASGANQRQVQAIADEVIERLKKSGTPAARVEGYRSAEWILVDYGDFILHVFEDKARKFYDLERLWREGKRIELPPDYANEAAGSLRTES
jgi:ribosome-associated protein